MKSNVFLKSTLRQPLRTAFFLLLIGFITFAFTARLIEYVAIEREIRNLSRFYRSIGVIWPIDQNNWDISEGIRLISQSPYIAFDDLHGRSAAVLNNIYNADIGGFSSYFISQPAFREQRLSFWMLDEPLLFFEDGLYMSDIYFVGTFRFRDDIPFTDEFWQENSRPRLRFDVEAVISGYPEYAREGGSVQLYFYPDGAEWIEEFIAELEIGGRYFIRAHFDPNFRPIGGLSNIHNRLTFRPLIENELMVMPIKSDTEVDFDDPILAGLWERVEVNNENRRAVVVRPTRDMGAIFTFWPETLFYIREGRALNHDDYINATNLAVIHIAFAQLRGLGIGDTITLTFRDLENTEHPFQLIKDGYDLNWREYPTYTKEFEIVGLYDSLLPSDTLNHIFVYVPASTVPHSFGIWPDYNTDMISSGEYNFVLNSPREQGAFITEYGDRLAQMGMMFHFMDTGAVSFFEAADPISRNALLNTIVFGVLLALTLALVVFLYLFGRRKDAAILRALGATQTHIVRQLCSPITIIGIISIAAGGVIAWLVTIAQAAEHLADIPRPEGVEIVSAMPPIAAVIMCVCVAILLLLFTLIGTITALHKPVLEQLQGANKK